jgi:hypothetical protein
LTLRNVAVKICALPCGGAGDTVVGVRLSNGFALAEAKLHPPVGSVSL